MIIEGQGHFFTIYFPGCVCFVLYNARISGERLQDHWPSGLSSLKKIVNITYPVNVNPLYQVSDSRYTESLVTIQSQSLYTSAPTL